MSLGLADIAHGLVDAARWCHAMGGAPATSGNFSARLGSDIALVTASGGDKGRLGLDDLLVTRLDGKVLGTAGGGPAGRPSAETLLHLQLYRRDPEIAAVLHVHTVAATVLSRQRRERVSLQGYELAKALRGVTTHETVVELPIVDNLQDIEALALAVDERLTGMPAAPGYLIAGHGLYTWGPSLAVARRHVEALDFLFRCELLEGGRGWVG